MPDNITGDLANLWAVGGKQVPSTDGEGEQGDPRYRPDWEVCCTECGWQLTGKFSTCPKCGADLRLKPCPYCRGTVPARADECPRCTAPLH